MSYSRNAISTMNQAIIVISLCAVFFFYKYILQNFPSVMAPELINSFHLQGLGLGVLSGAYFWTYLIVPLFVGIILDHWGVRWITTGAILCCSIGIFIFAQTEQLYLAIMGRILMGVGVSFATLSYFKLASVWFARKHYTLLTSLLVTAGMLGAVCGQTPLAWIIHQAGWRSSLANLGWIGLVLAVIFALFVKDHPSSPIESTSNQELEDSSLWHNILLILKNKQNWLLTGYGGLAFAPLVIFCGLWGNPFLQKAYQVDPLTAPSLISLAFVGLGIGSPLFALFANRIRNRCAFMGYSTLISAAALSLIIYAHPLPVWMLACLIFLFGFSLGSFPMVFVMGKELNPLYLAGTTLSLINASDAFFDAITEPLIGKILDCFEKVGSAHDFSILSYHVALAILPLYQIVSVYLLRRVKDKHSQQKAYSTTSSLRTAD